MSEWMRDIVCRSSSMAERRAGEFQAAEALDEEEVAAVRKKWDRWCHSAAKGDWESFSSRLALAELTMHDAERLLGPARLREGAELPEWTVVLQRIASAVEQAGKGTAAPEMRLHDPIMVPGEPFPFEHLFLPVLEDAERSLKERAGSLADALTPNAWTAVKRSLLRSLTQLSWRPLELEFSVFRFGTVTSPDSRTEYFRFIGEMLRGRWSVFLREYSVLAKLMAVTVRNWEDALLEFLQRYETDQPWRNGRIVSGPRSSGAIEALEWDGADSHNGGRRVMIVALKDGGKLVYKPKSLALDAAYSRLLVWLREQGAPCDLATTEQMDCGNYGWQSFVGHEPLADDSEFVPYYRRAGGLLCLAHMLGATDLHEENVIAHGACPVLIDVETLLQPLAGHERSDDPAADAEELASGRKARSVLRTMLLPNWRSARHADGKEISGLFGGPLYEPIAVRGLIHPNTDAMKMGSVPYKQPVTANLPFLPDRGRDFDFAAVSRALIQGFREMYLFLLANRDRLLAEEGPLSAFKGLPARLLFRPTAAYSQLLESSLSPELLRSGVDRDIQLDAMCRFLAADGEMSDRWPLVQRELDALWSMDIPYFQIRTDDFRVSDRNGPYGPVLFDRSGYDSLIRTLRQMSRNDCDFQTSMIRGTLYAKLVERDSAHSASGFRSRDQAARLADTEPATGVLEAAEAIAARLNAEAVIAPDGTRTWIAPRLNGRIFRQRLLGPDLYDGVCGIALFYAALAGITGKTSYRADALSTLRLLRVKLGSEEFFANTRIGGMVGLGSILYTFVRVSRLIDEPELLGDANLIASRITEQRIRADDRFDVMHGAAGAILSLLVLYETEREPGVLKKAVQCGEHLLRNRTTRGEGFRVWAAESGIALAGFSHGASGIAYALFRLFVHTQDERFLEASREAIRYEASIFRSDRGLWPDLRMPEGEEGLTDAWCHGAAGIGLARLGALNAMDREALHADIETAVRIVRSGLYGSGKDHLCCGAMGRVEFLFSAGRRLNRQDVESEARHAAARIVAKASECESDSFYRPLGFFNGLAGIGYEWLRLHWPDELPSVLVME